MIHRPHLLANILTVFLSAASCAAYAQSQAQSAGDRSKPEAVSPAAATAVTTTGGTANKVAKFSGANTIVNSILFDNGTQVGVGTTSPSATLTVSGTMTVNGTATQNGQLGLPATGTATPTKGFSSQPLRFTASSYNSSSSSAITPRFQLQAEAVGNDSTSANGTLNVLASTTSSTPVETGLYINSNGTIHFAPAQTFPGGSAFCVATNNGFGNGGTTFIAPNLAVPSGGKCSAWSGFTKTASTVVLFSSGVACLSSDAKKLTLSVSSADPSFFGAGNNVGDFIQLTRTSTSGSFTTGTDQGQFSGSAAQVTCSSTLLQLNENND